MTTKILTNFWRFVSQFAEKGKNLVSQELNISQPQRLESAVMDDDRAAHEQATAHLMELDLLKHKLKRLVSKLQKHDVPLEVFDSSDIQYGDVIGKGGEGIVRKCTINYLGIVNLEAAAKTLCDNSPDSINLTLEEIELLCLAQDHIFATTVKVYGMAAIPSEDYPEYGQLVILTEAGIMNALQLYQDLNVPLCVTLDLWSRLAAAMHIIHSKKIIHQDLKPENILITDIKENQNSEVEKIDFRIIDMGMARRVFTEKVITDDILGTNGYHPPEVLFEDGYDFRADIFMLGITFAVMLHSPTFLRSKSLSGLLKKLHDAKLKNMAGKQLYEEIIEPTIEQEVPSAVKDMLCEMMERQDDRHLTLSDITQICAREAVAKTLSSSDNNPPVLQPQCSAVDGSDSGFGATSSSSVFERAKPPGMTVSASGCSPSLRPRRRLRHKRREDDMSPTVSMSSTRTCMTEMSATYSSGCRQTRAMKRRYHSDMSLVEEGEPVSPRKRTRRGTLRY